MSRRQAPSRPTSPLVSREEWYDIFLGKARDLMASSSVPSPPPPLSVPHVDPTARQDPLGTTLGGGEVVPESSQRVLRTGPRSQRRRRHYDYVPAEEVVDVDGCHKPFRGTPYAAVDGRLGFSWVTGKAYSVWKDFSEETFGVPSLSDHESPMEVWGRTWIVKESTLGPEVGLGLFALEDIVVPPRPFQCSCYDGEYLFPYIGPVYSSKSWKILTRQHPSWAVYALKMNSDPDELIVRPEHCRMIDGDPIRSGNIAGYINSCQGPRGGQRRPPIEPNVEWVQVFGSPCNEYCHTQMDDHIMTVAIRTIRAGDELICDYSWDPPKR